ncbi:MAG: hypothetical protein ABWZ66_07265 [Pyrinomonadaceae bacterium]
MAGTVNGGKVAVTAKKIGLLAPSAAAHRNIFAALIENPFGSISSYIQTAVKTCTDL